MVLSYTCLACFIQFVSSPLLFEDFVKLKMVELVIKDLQEIGTHPTLALHKYEEGKIVQDANNGNGKENVKFGDFCP